MSRRTQRKLLEALWVLAIVSLALSAAAATGGCSSVRLERSPDGVSVEYRSFMTKIQAPVVEVEKDGDYQARFNAESVDRGVDLRAVRDIIEMGLSGRIPEEN